MHAVRYVIFVFALGTLGILMLSPVKFSDSPPDATLKPDTKWLLETLRDPQTGGLPDNARARAIASLQKNALAKRAEILTSYRWQSAGPQNLGGRTRALAVDLDNHDRLVAGGVLGGLWHSLDRGSSWQQIIAEPLSITAIAQDPRPGEHHVWYAAGGEFVAPIIFDNRAIAPYTGNGLWKSEDGGVNWQQLQPTHSDQTLEFDYVHRISISPVTGSLFIAKNGSGVYRSRDGGKTFELVKGEPGQHIWSEIVINSRGELLAAMSRTKSVGGAPTSSPGLFKSDDDGNTWENISPFAFGANHNRTVMAFAPSAPDTAYAMTLSFPTQSDGHESILLHRVRFSTGATENLTANLPKTAGTPLLGASIFTQSGYNMAIAVKPDDADFVLLGGTSVYRSRDGFATPLVHTSASVIGGYLSPTNGIVASNHYVDQHLLLFAPDNADFLYSTNDGGIFASESISAAAPAWQTLNTGYQVSQYYAVAISDSANDARIVGGTQDFGNQYLDFALRSDAPSDAVRLSPGDGSTAFIGDNYLFISTQFGRMRRIRYANAAQTEFILPGYVLQPSGATNLAFIQPFVIEPIDQEVMFYPEGNALWRNTELKTSNPRPQWQKLDGVFAPAGYRFTAFSFSRSPKHTLYVGAYRSAGAPKLYRMKEAVRKAPPPDFEEIDFPGANGAYIKDIAINPLNGNEFLVVLSNYGIERLYHTVDAGSTFTVADGSLDGDETEVPISVRSAEILPNAIEGGQTYVIGTTVGLFATDALLAENTEWQQMAPEVIGNAIIEDIATRESDGRIVAASHGRGVFVGDPAATTHVGEARISKTPGLSLHVYPNPAREAIQVQTLACPESALDLRLINTTGQQVQAFSGFSPAKPFRLQTSSLAAGLYFLRMTATCQHNAHTGQAAVRRVVVLH